MSNNTLPRIKPKKKHVEHRQLTIDAMVKFGPDHFNMSNWYTSRGGEDYYPELLDPQQLIDPKVDLPLTACGTTACLAGTAAAAAKMAGLKIRMNPKNDDSYTEAIANWLGISDIHFSWSGLSKFSEWAAMLGLLIDANNGIDVDHEEYHYVIEQRLNGNDA